MASPHWQNAHVSPATSDAGVDAGNFGCMPPHDACLVDSDCGTTGVCDCETPRCTEPFALAGNVCVPGDCRVDSDCTCGFCAGDTSCGQLQGYHWACVSGEACPG